MSGLNLISEQGDTQNVYAVTNDFSVTINAGNRSADTSITGLESNKIKIIGVAVSSENDTDWRVKFYSSSTFDGTTYADNTFMGNIELYSFSSNAVGAYEADAEAELCISTSSNTLYVILENFGSNNSKAYLTVCYEAI